MKSSLRQKDVRQKRAYEEDEEEKSFDFEGTCQEWCNTTGKTKRNTKAELSNGMNVEDVSETISGGMEKMQVNETFGHCKKKGKVMQKRDEEKYREDKQMYDLSVHKQESDAIPCVIDSLVELIMMCDGDIPEELLHNSFIEKISDRKYCCPLEVSHLSKGVRQEIVNSIERGEQPVLNAYCFIPSVCEALIRLENLGEVEIHTEQSIIVSKEEDCEFTHNVVPLVGRSDAALMQTGKDVETYDLYQEPEEEEEQTVSLMDVETSESETSSATNKYLESIIEGRTHRQIATVNVYLRDLKKEYEEICEFMTDVCERNCQHFCLFREIPNTQNLTQTAIVEQRLPGNIRYAIDIFRENDGDVDIVVKPDKIAIMWRPKRVYYAENDDIQSHDHQIPFIVDTMECASGMFMLQDNEEELEKLVKWMEEIQKTK